VYLSWLKAFEIDDRLTSPLGTPATQETVTDLN
jgi:hypothetical protein